MSEPAEPATIVIADDHEVVRGGLRALLEAQPDFEVVSEAGDLASTRRAVLGHKPSILVLDLHMPDGTSLDIIPDLLDVSPETRIVILTMQNDTVYAREALRAGAVGYVLKQAATAELITAVRTALDGGTYLHPELGARLATESADGGRAGDLSEREVEVLRLIALGHTNAEIAGQLFLSVRTVESHRAHIQQKLSLQTRAQLVRYALENRLVEV